MTNIILASQSTIRQKILANAGITHTAMPAHIDEDALKNAMQQQQQTVADCAHELARLKALKISMQYEQDFIIGADQIAICDNIWLSKSSNIHELKEKLCFLRNKKHALISAVVIAHQGQIIWHCNDEVTLTMRHFSDAFLTNYIEQNANKALQTVGGYLYEEVGIQLFSDIKGDYYSLLGLPLLPLLQQLRFLNLCPS